MRKNDIRVGKRGRMTLPVEMRSQYRIRDGTKFTLIDLGDGSFLLAPYASEVNRLGETVSKVLTSQGVTEDILMASLEEERERYYQEHFSRS